MKKGVKSVYFLLFVILISCVFVNADLGPKPSMDIHVTLNGQNLTEEQGDFFLAKILNCQEEGNTGYLPDKDVLPKLNISQYDSKKNCYWKPDSMAWGGECVNSTCHFGYNLPSEFRLAVYLWESNKVYISNEIKRENFESAFEANLLSDGSIEMRETTPSFNKSRIREFITSFIITLILELLVALVYLSSNKITKKILIYVLIANIISLPIVWLITPLNLFNGINLMLALAEIFAFVFEAFFIYVFNKQAISLKQSFTLSFVMNITSLFLGSVILIFLRIFFGIGI